MPTYNFSFKITTGKRTKPKVSIYPTSVNEKQMVFQNGKIKSNEEMSSELQKIIQGIIDEYNSRPT